IGPICADLSAFNRELGVARCDARELMFVVLRPELCDDVHKRSPGSDRRKLRRITYENEALHSLQRVEERAQHIFREHRCFVDDDGTESGRFRTIGDYVASRLTIVSTLRIEKLRNRLSASGRPSCKLLHAHSSRSEEHTSELQS